MSPPPDAISVAVEWVLPTLAAAALLCLALRPPSAEAPDPLRGWRGAAAFLATRVAYAVVLLVVLDRPFRSDMWAWRSNTDGMARGEVPGRDFFNLYGPLYPYLQAWGRWLTPGHHPLGTLWIFVAGDALAVSCGTLLARDLLGPGGARVARSWLLLDPILWHQLVVRAQDESLFVGTLAAAAWLVHRERRASAAAALAFGFCATKVTYGPYALAVLLAMWGGGRKGIGPAALFAALVVAAYAWYLSTGASLLSDSNFETHSVNWGVGVSATDGVARVLPSFPKAAALAAYGLGTAAALGVAAVVSRGMPAGPRAVALLCVAHAMSLLTMPFCVSPYLAQGVVPVLLLFLVRVPGDPGRRWRLAGLATVSWLGAMHWTQWRGFSLPMKPVAIAFHAVVLAEAWRVLKGRAGPGGTA